jgi:hypothetical protein
LSPATTFSPPSRQSTITLPRPTTGHMSSATLPSDTSPTKGFTTTASRVVVRCLWAECHEDLTLPQERVRECLRAHFLVKHEEVLIVSGEDKDCLWLECHCNSRPSRCEERLRNHAAHVKDVFNHVYKRHVEKQISGKPRLNFTPLI